MGTYLSTPVTDKHKESGECLDNTTVPVSWGLVDMQGWRKSMEDAHVAVTGLPIPKHLLIDDESDAEGVDAKVFGVFDGHGGAEVARFCQLYFVSVLTHQATWKGEEQETTKDIVNKSEEGEDGGDNAAAAQTPTEGDPALHGVGRALVSSFHALDRLIHDPTRRAEIYALRTGELADGETRTVDYIPSLTPSDTVQEITPASIDAKPAPAANPDQVETEGNTNAKESDVTESRDEESADKASAAVEAKLTADETGKEDGVNAETDSAEKDDDSLDVAGKQEAAEQDRDMMDEAAAQDVSGASLAEKDDSDDSDAVKISGSNVAGMFAKILQLGGVGKGAGADGAGEGQSIMNLNQLGRAALAGTKTGASASLPTIIQNGRMMCNLPDHPVHAGCTAIVAVLAGRVLTVANAGDSRAVLCRAGGVTCPLSFDHKPQQEREMSRIINAGGYVNHLGRVNGNLNLSRSIGDLKYKQVPGVLPAEQIISAEPDIKQITLKSDDEFIILGCDGIWDCLTNEQAVEYVKSRIDRMTPIEIGEEMLSEIISDDPRTTQGIGGDNMTIMIVDLQPKSRKYPSVPASSDADTTEATKGN